MKYFHTKQSSTWQTCVAQKVPVDDFISERLVSALGRRFAAALLPRLFGTNPRSHHKGATVRDISRPRRVRTAAKSQSDSKCGPASAMAQSRLARVRCGTEPAGRVKRCPEQARAGQPSVRPKTGRPGRGDSTS